MSSYADGRQSGENPGGKTPIYEFPWPPSTAPADPPEDFQALAERDEEVAAHTNQRIDSTYNYITGVDGRVNTLDGRVNALDASTSHLEGRVDYLDWFREAIDWRMQVSESRLDNLDFWSGGIDYQVYQNLPTLIVNRELITLRVVHSQREVYDLPANPEQGQRVLVFLDPSTFNTGAGGEQANAPWWLLQWDVLSWRVISGLPMIAWTPWNSGVLPGTGLWEPVGGPTIFNPYRFMRVVVRHGSFLGGVQGWAAGLSDLPHHSQNGISVWFGTTNIVAANANVVASPYAISLGFLPEATDVQITTFGGAPTTNNYEHSWRWLEVMPTEIGVPGIHGPLAAPEDRMAASEFPPTPEPIEPIGPPGSLVPEGAPPLPVGPGPNDGNEWPPPVERGPEQGPLTRAPDLILPPGYERKAPPAAPPEWVQQRRKELEDEHGPGPAPPRDA